MPVFHGLQDRVFPFWELHFPCPPRKGRSAGQKRQRFRHIRPLRRWYESCQSLSLLDYAYGLWLLTVVGTIALVAASPRDALRRTFVLSCLLLWIFGAMLYVALPARGPAYAYPALAAELEAGLVIAPASQARLGENDAMLRREGRSALGRVDVTRGVAALPSLHVGFHVLFALWAWRERARLWPVVALLALATFVASVRTGWHYAIDGYLGALLAGCVFWLARRWLG